tara:strand:- start:1459 stop:2235 length:777 start_codon:yes stop_codon:yes gene_type:complete
MHELNYLELFFIAIIFIWSGFVRSGLGFGGAVLSLPFLLLIHDDPLVFLPIIAVHLIIFSSWIMYQNNVNNKHSNEKNSVPDWIYLRRTIKIMIIPKFLGIFGLITLPPKIMSTFIFIVVATYSLSYIFNKKINTSNKWSEILFLGAGGYVSGTSLTAAPLIIPIFANNVLRHKLRSTLFTLWFFLVVIKLLSFIIIGINLQLIHHLWLFPCALVGHLLGEKIHKKIMLSNNTNFYRILGTALLLTSFIGLIKTFYVN